MRGWLIVSGLVAALAFTGCSDWESAPPSATNTPGPVATAAQPEVDVTPGEGSQAAGDPQSAGGSASSESQTGATPNVPTQQDPVALCRYIDESGMPINAPCGDPGVPGLTPAPAEEPATAPVEITCETPCDSSACEQYKYVVLNCP